MTRSPRSQPFAATLRARLLLILVLVNSIVLGTLALWAAGDEVQQEAVETRRLGKLQELVRERMDRYERAGDLAALLTWPAWQEFEDVLIMEDRWYETNVGSLVPTGAYWNPLGSRRRQADFPYQDISRAISRAVERSDVVAVADGLALPVVTGSGSLGEGRVVAGVYVVPPSLPTVTPIWARVLFAAALVTLLGGGLVYLLFGVAVVRPVEELAAAVRAFGSGRRPQLPRGRQAAEFEGLVDAFGSMMDRILGFQGELQREVDLASARAQQAERHAARQDRLAAMGTLAAGLAHEINSPLAGALQGLEILRKEASSERGQRYGELMADALERIGGLVRRLLHLAPARIEAGSCVIQQVAADLPDFLASRLRRHELKLDFPEQELRVRGAAGDLFPVLLNLVQNALDALDGVEAAGGCVEVVARARADGGAELWVRDNGPGADADLLPHLFEPFVTSKEVGQGTGLGLALAHATIRQLGGEMEAHNRTGDHAQSGLEVRIQLPAIQT